MVTTFNSKDMVRFGEYLLSTKRTNLIKSNHSKEDNISLEERLKEVYHADFENWKALQNEFKNITSVGQMCLESLDPKDFEAWEKVRDGLMWTRKSLQK